MVQLYQGNFSIENKTIKDPAKIIDKWHENKVTKSKISSS